MSRRNKFTSRDLKFNDLYHLVDCLMLFGAGIEHREGGCLLTLRRRRKRWASLSLVIMVAMSQDMEMDLLNFRIRTCGSEILEFRTRTSRFLEKSWERWYPDGQMVRPADVAMDEKALLFWVLGAWSPHRTLILPMLGRRESPGIPWPYLDQGQGFKILEKGLVEGWMRGAVPERVWG